MGNLKYAFIGALFLLVSWLVLYEIGCISNRVQSGGREKDNFAAGLAMIGLIVAIAATVFGVLILVERIVMGKL